MRPLRRHPGRRTLILIEPRAESAGVEASLGLGAAERFAALRLEGHTLSVVQDDLPALGAALARCGGAAAIVMAPMLFGPTPTGYLLGARRLADAHGAVLIFDEVQTGLRLGAGGVQGLCGVAPDLAVYGPSLANGFPIGAVAGRRSLVRAPAWLAPPAAMSLAAACACLETLDREPVFNTLQVRGAEVQAEVEHLAACCGAGDLLNICGDPTYSFVVFSTYKGVHASALERRFRDETLARGMFTLGAHVLSYAHGDDEVCALLDAYAEVFPMLMDWVDAAGAAGPANPSAAAFRPQTVAA